MLALASLQLLQKDPVGLAISGGSDIKRCQLFEFILAVSDHRSESRIRRHEMLCFAENCDAHERVCDNSFPPRLVRLQFMLQPNEKLAGVATRSTSFAPFRRVTLAPHGAAWHRCLRPHAAIYIDLSGCT